MKNKTLPAYLEKQHIYNILGDLRVCVTLESNPYNIPVDRLFSMAARQNKKRGFLFVSEVLGKHIPVSPRIPLLAGAALANRYMEVVYGKSIENTEDIIQALITEKNQEKVYQELQKKPLLLPENTLFIGFAETATALGHAMFNCFQERASYIHTTRELLQDKEPILDFQEEHSHATTHRLYTLNEELLSSASTIVLVDDEITTGKTALNIIEAIQRKYPKKNYAIVSLLDWRTEEYKEMLAEKERQLKVCIHSISLVSGYIEVEGSFIGEENKEALRTPTQEPNIIYHKLQLQKSLFKPLLFSSINVLKEENHSPYIKETGRFGIASKDKEDIDKQAQEAAELLKKYRRGKKTLCLGTGEFMYLPMEIAAGMGEGISYHSTTRSPIHPCSKLHYGIKNAFSFKSPEEPTLMNYVYNIPSNYYDELFIFFEREMPKERLESLLQVLKGLGIYHVHIVFCMGNEDFIKEPVPMGSYREEDSLSLLKDIGDFVEEQDTEDREEAIQGGTHYSEMLPKEYKPSAEYMDLFYHSLEESAEKLAVAVGVTAERILQERGSENLVLVSLARAGTPIGILIKRYLAYRYNLNVPHYSISIIRGKGIDENALRYIIKKHPHGELQFIDGWTGKGAIAKVLTKSCEDFKETYGKELKDDLAVLADPGHCVKIYGTREDFLIASSCLNATVSGLLSRTVHRKDLIGEHDFHGAKYYSELTDEDVSYVFVDRITEQFPAIEHQVKKQLTEVQKDIIEPSWEGWKNVERIKQDYQVEDVNLVKPGIGETTRVLLRRVPWKILIREENNPNLKHILLLARDRKVEVELYPQMTYLCCGIIQPMGEE